MVAPNGARRTKEDHAGLPLTIDEIALTAAECNEAGARAIHVHVRDKNHCHVLDAAMYRAAIAAIAVETNGQMLVQITTESVGQFSAQQQRDVVQKVMPEAVSVALGEMIPDASEEKPAAEFYQFALDADIAVQHILYSPQDIESFAGFVRREIIPGEYHSLLFPLGRYVDGQQSDPVSLVEFLAMLEKTNLAGNCEWAVCAFGVGETRALAAAMAMGGKVRVGFENSLHHADGSLARDNADRVAVIAKLAGDMALA